MREKRCGDCVNNENGTCENWDKGTGIPCSCAPPYDTACSNFSKNPADKNKPPESMEAISKILDVVGVDKWEDLPGKHIRFEDAGWGSTVTKIGNIITDKWFDMREFFS